MMATKDLEQTPNVAHTNTKIPDYDPPASSAPPASSPAPKRDLDEQFEWLMFTRDNNKPNVYGSSSTEKGKLSFQKVADLYGQRYNTVVTQQAISKRLKNENSLKRFFKSHPQYPKEIIYGGPTKISNKRKNEVLQVGAKHRRMTDDGQTQETSTQPTQISPAHKVSKKRKVEADETMRKRVKLGEKNGKTGTGTIEIADGEESKANSESDETDGCESDEEDREEGDPDTVESKRYKVTWCGAFHTGWNRNSIYVPPREITQKPYFAEDHWDNDDNNTYPAESVIGSQPADDPSNPRCRINGSPVRYNKYPLYFDHDNSGSESSDSSSDESSDDGW